MFGHPASSQTVRAEVVDRRAELAVALADALRTRSHCGLRCPMSSPSSGATPPGAGGAGGAAPHGRQTGQLGGTLHDVVAPARSHRRTRWRPGPRKRRPRRRRASIPRLQRGDAATGNAARDDVVEHGQSEATLRATPWSVPETTRRCAQRAHADGGDFAGVRPTGAEPDAGELTLGRRAGQTKVGHVAMTICSSRWTCAGPAAGSSGTVTIG